MSRMNTVIIDGRAGSDPEMRYSERGKAITTVNIAHTEYRKTDGEYKEMTHWVPIIAFDKQAERLAGAHKGDLLVVCGRFSTRVYVDKNGNNRTDYRIVCDDIRVIPKQGGQNKESSTQDEFYDSIWE